ncbi:hypothetical protein HN451_10765, partial [archaeon]|nr:hypothetical protein [archaeon]
MKFNPFSNKKRKEEKLKKKVFGEEKLKLREEVKDITKLSLSEKFALKKKQEEREKELQDIAEGKKIKNLQEVKEKKNIVKKESLKEEKKIDIFKSRNDKIISQEPKKKISFKERFLSKKKKQEKTISERLEEKSGKEDKKNKFKKINESQDIRTKLAKKNKKGKRKKIDYKKGIISIIINRIDIPNFKEYLDKAGLQFEFSTISKGIQTLAIFMNFLLSLFLIFRVYQTKPESIKSLLFFLLVFTIGTCVLIMFIWITLYIIVSIKFRREKNTFGIETNSDVGKRRSFFSNLDKMGINISKKTVLSLYVKLSIILNMVINGYLFYNFTEANPPIIHIIVVSLSIWLLGFILLFILIWILFLVFVDLKIYKRKKEIEEVLP